MATILRKHNQILIEFLKVNKYFSDKNKDLKFWFVTNTDDISDNLKQFCKEKKIQLKKGSNTYKVEENVKLVCIKHFINILIN